jgi:hypothetical protein
MFTEKTISSPNEETLVRARALRDEYAKAAALYANRIERTEVSARVGPVAQWTAQYQRSSARCRALGEIIRGERA